MKAKFNGWCTECGGRVHVGDEVRFNGRGRGVRHADAEVCEANERDYEYDAEQRAEMRMEAYAEAHLMGYGARAREEGWF